MKKLILFSALALLIFATLGCEKEDKQPLYQAKGYVLGATSPCEGNALYIEIINPKGIGKKGTFKSVYGKNNPQWNYNNAIGVPHFDKVNLPPELMKKGTFLHFEYREYNPEKDQHYFQYDGFCTFDKIPPTATYYVITKIISYKINKK